MNAVLVQIINVVVILLFVVFGAALLTWVERRLLGIWQDRYGPNRVGPFGSLQIVADMIKLLMKQDWVPPFADRLVFIVAPAIAMFVVVAAFAVIPMAPGVGVIDLNIGLLFFLAMTSLGVYAVMFGAYASDNKYALLGGLRAAAQMVSYEVFMGLSLMGVVMLAGSFNLREVVLAQADGWYIVPQFVGFLIFFMAGIAESHRTPFDLPEAEHELTAGFHTEYSGMKFAMFFLGEYVSVLMTAAMITVLFLGGWLGPAWLPPLAWFLLKTAALVLSMILIRGALPRPRYDQLMAFGWKLMLPLALINLLATGALTLM
ncbi:MAG: NADH-quinone oxidoreductase subunit NuoH [Gammaproteobacteria bacterium]|nr:NADH-quinone oxidoreductase subunit NuoH [Gammaproteobacteria bacterium]MCP4878917.1 NADH-quinone oxidoreductase subunit NuoH [Gammaproteobacteria bacterium]MDP6166069.1 NADH-quinone oxidoreductase subunit NuoH [Gammaproteobacteria bacterium]